MRYTKYGSCVECLAIQATSEEKKRYDLAYYAQNREQIVRRSRLYYASNAERLMQLGREWMKKNPEKAKSIKKAYKARRRAIELSGDSTAAVHEWEVAAKKVCYWCGTECKANYQIDHYVPLSRGGKHEVANLVIACKKCNLRKNAKDPFAFAQSVGRLF